MEGYQIDIGTYQEGSHSQITILTIPTAANNADAAFSCVITSTEHGISGEKNAVNSHVFSKYTQHMLPSAFFLNS